MKIKQTSGGHVTSTRIQRKKVIYESPHKHFTFDEDHRQINILVKGQNDINNPHEHHRG